MEQPAFGLGARQSRNLFQSFDLVGLPVLELGGAGAQSFFPTGELPAPFVELRVAPVEGGVAVVEAFLDAGELGTPGPDLSLSLVLYFKRGLLGGELGLAPGGLGGTGGVLDDGTGVGAGLGLARRNPPLTEKVARGGAERETGGQPQDQR